MNYYKKKTWVDGEVITADALNNMETGIANASTTANDAQVTAEAAQKNLTAHNTHKEAHADLRAELKALADRINAVLDSDDTTLDELSEIVAYIKSNKSLIDAITTSKVSVSDIVNNLTTNVTNKPLSAAQGVALKALIDAATTSLGSLTTGKVSVSDIVNNLTTNVANKPLSAAQGVALKALIDALTTSAGGKAPKNHASTGTDYGAGNGSNYGHVKLSDATNSASGANGGVAATPAAVKAAYDLAKGKAPAYTYGTADIQAGSPSTAPNGTLHFVYE